MVSTPRARGGLGPSGAKPQPKVGQQTAKPPARATWRHSISAPRPVYPPMCGRDRGDRTKYWGRCLPARPRQRTEYSGSRSFSDDDVFPACSVGHATFSTSLLGSKTSIGNNVRRVGNSSPPRRHSPSGPLPGLARGIAHSFFANFRGLVWGGWHSAPTALGGQQMRLSAWVGARS